MNSTKSYLKNIGIALFSIIIITSIVLIYIFLANDDKKEKTNNPDIVDVSGDKYFTFAVKNIEGSVITLDRVSYNDGDSLFDVLNDKYNLIYDNTIYGHYITGISTIETNGTSSWIWMEIAYLNDGKEFSNDINFDDYTDQYISIGIDGQNIVENMLIAFNEQDNTHNTTIYSSNLSFNSPIIDSPDIINTNSIWNSLIFKISLYIILGVIILLIIILTIFKFKSKGNKITVKQLSIIAFMTAILFVQEELLTVLPNFQFTFLLIGLYAAIFGIRYSLLITVTHVFLDNLIMGSLTPIVMIPMFVGYIVLVVFEYLVRNRRLYVKTIVAVVGSLLYCYMFLVTNAIFLDINIEAYFIADLPFEALLVLSTIITYTLCYKPLYKIIMRFWNMDNNQVQTEDNDM